MGDCVNDLSWIKSKCILIKHDDLPRLTDADLKVYLEVLADAVYNWKGDPHELIVAFPYSQKDHIVKLIGMEDAQPNK